MSDYPANPPPPETDVFWMNLAIRVLRMRQEYSTFHSSVMIPAFGINAPNFGYMPNIRSVLDDIVCYSYPRSQHEITTSLGTCSLTGLFYDGIERYNPSLCTEEDDVIHTRVEIDGKRKKLSRCLNPEQTQFLNTFIQRMKDLNEIIRTSPEIQNSSMAHLLKEHTLYKKEIGSIPKMEKFVQKYGQTE
jgi:hypothetical protein